jgi:hypothetical protein
MLGPGAALAAEPLVVFNVLLLQPSKLLEARVPDVDAMAAYIQAVQAAAGEAVRASGAQQATGGYIAVAVRPGGQSKVWLDFDALLDLALRRELLSRTQAVKPFEATGGPVVFALQVATWQGPPPKRAAPAPIEWKPAARGEAALEVGELVERAWPADPPQADPGPGSTHDVHKAVHKAAHVP